MLLELDYKKLVNESQIERVLYNLIDNSIRHTKDKIKIVLRKNSNFAKLTQEDINKIFELRKQGLTQQKIANIIGCTRSNISYILNHKTWQV